MHLWLHGGIDEQKGGTSDTVHIQNNDCREYVMNQKIVIGLLKQFFARFHFRYAIKSVYWIVKFGRLKVQRIASENVPSI